MRMRALRNAVAGNDVVITTALIPGRPAPRLIRDFSVVYPKERFRSRLVNTFVQFAKDRLAALQAP